MPTRNMVVIGILMSGTFVLSHVANTQQWTMAFSALLITSFTVAVIAVARQLTPTLALVMLAWVAINVLLTYGQR
jgi:hypothetical protein